MGARDVLERAVAAGLELSVEGDLLVVRPKAKLTDDLRAALRQAKPELLALLNRPYRLNQIDADRCHWPAWSEREIRAFTARTVLFMRRGLSATDSDDLGERLVLRDRDQDDRKLCVECASYRTGRCITPVAAGLVSDAIGVELAAQLQRCPGFTSAD